MYGPYNETNLETFYEADDWHIQTAEEVYMSTYRGDVVFVWIKDNGLMVYTEMDGDFISGWKATDSQLEYHRDNGADIYRVPDWD